MLGIILLWAVVYLSGMMLCKIGGEKEASWLWVHLTGFFFLFLSQGMVFFGAQLAGWNFTMARDVLAVIYVLFSLLSLLVCKKEVGRAFGGLKQAVKERHAYGRYVSLVLWLLVGLIWIVVIYTRGSRGDAMVETVNTTLLTDTMNQFHPFTHVPFKLGVILSRKIITLPFWYAAVSEWTAFGAPETVYVVGTVLCFLLSLLAFGELGSLLFHRDVYQTSLLIVFLELLYLSGDYYIGAEGFRHLYYGYSGEIMVATIVIPVVITTLYRLCGPWLREDFDSLRNGISLWGAILKTGMALAVTLFLTTLVWGLLMVISAIFLFALSVAGCRLTKKIKLR